MKIDPKNQSYKENYKLLIGSIQPRPIALVSTVSKSGKPNLAPFSFFNGVCSNPPTIVFAPVRRSSDNMPKDTLINIRDTEEFVINIVSEDIVNPMVETATDFHPDVNEFTISNFTPVPSDKIKAPRVKESKINFECKLNKILEIGDGSPGSGFLVVGTIVMFHIDEDVFDEGRIITEKLKPIGRLAGNDFCGVNNIFKIARKPIPKK